MVRDPGLRAERQALGPGVPVWDRLLAPVVNLAVPATLLVACLDAGRFAWSGSIAVGWRVAGTVALMAAPVLVTAAMRANPFFSGLVRYQVERDHRAVMAGPYRWIRHPGYLGMALFYPGTALFLGALWALIPAGVGVGAILARTHLEDRWLARTLPGYLGYAGRVRYRLLPLVW